MEQEQERLEIDKGGGRGGERIHREIGDGDNGWTRAWSAVRRDSVILFWTKIMSWCAECGRVGVSWQGFIVCEGDIRFVTVSVKIYRI